MGLRRHHTEATRTASPALSPSTPVAVVQVEGLTLGFETEEGFQEVLSDVSFELYPGQVLALVGESGSGKSVTCLSLARLLPEPPARYVRGSIRVQGRPVLALSESELSRLRGGVLGYVFQEPSVSLNPVRRIGSQIAEAIRLHAPDTPRVNDRVVDLLRLVGIPEPGWRARAYPHQLSGGMQQRAMIAMALSASPAALIADEPTTALDVTVQAQVLRLLDRLRRETGAGLLLVTHDLGVVAETADRVAVMYAGQIVEEAPVESLFRAPRHPYTQALLRAVPRLGGPDRRLVPIPGRVPLPSEYGLGCRFASRCDRVGPACRDAAPDLLECAAGHRVRCRPDRLGEAPPDEAARPA